MITALLAKYYADLVPPENIGKVKEMMYSLIERESKYGGYELRYSVKKEWYENIRSELQQAGYTVVDNYSVPENEAEIHLFTISWGENNS